jgi:trehalose synthase
VFQVDVAARALSPFLELVGPARIESITRDAELTRRALGEHTVWNINSTAAGGGVAEILRSLLKYARGLGVDVHWLVIEGPPEFFTLTKRLHNALHGHRGDGSPLGPAEAALYERVLEDNFAELEPLLRPGDAVICHDPQTAGLVPRLRRRGANVIWRCHVGHDGGGPEIDAAWRFLRPYLADVPIAVFSRSEYAPSWLPDARAVTVPPNIDPFSVKNQWIPRCSVRSILRTIGVIEPTEETCHPVYVAEDGSARSITRPADIVRAGDAPNARVPLVVQVSRWDRMKDHAGVLSAFAQLARDAPHLEAQLILAGPSAGRIADDPEGPAVFREVEAAFEAQPVSIRRRVQLVQLPMADTDENAAMVNALQRHATVIVQKSLREGFGLTVTEAMWKSRPIVASAVGGLTDQIRDGVEGLLVRDPTYVKETASAIARILESPALRRRLGTCAHERACTKYLSIGSLERWGRLLRMLYE